MEWCQIPLEYTAEWHKGNYKYTIVSVLVANKVLFRGVIGKTKSYSWGLKIFMQSELAI